MAAEEPRDDMKRELGPARRRRAIRAAQRNTQALVIAAIPIVVLIAVVALGVWLIQSRQEPSEAAAASPTHLPTLKPATLVSASRPTPSPEPAALPSPTVASEEEAPTAEPTEQPTVAPEEPTSAPEEPTLEPTAIPDDALVAGVQALVSGTNGRGLRMRSGAGINEPTLMVIAEGTVVQVTAGPTEADDFVWYQVRDDSGTEGWVAADWLVRAQ